MLVRLVVAASVLLAVSTAFIVARADLAARDDAARPAPVATASVAASPAPATTTPPASPEPVASTGAPAAGAPATTAPGTPILQPVEERIVRRLTGVLGRARVRGRVGVAVLGGAGEPVFASGELQAMLPASTQKLPVAAAALSRLGPRFHYVTEVHATAVPDGRGVVDGDLVLVGGGDPTLSSPEFAVVEPDRPRTAMSALVRRIRRAGVRRVTGRIVGDPTIFADEPVAAGWLPRYFDQLDATRISGLTVDAGRRIFRSQGTLRAVPAEDPAQQAARTLRRLLRAARVRVDGGAVSVREPVPTTTQLAQVTSPPMGRLLRYMVQRSDNHLADTIFRTLGAADKDSTWVGAAGAVATTLAPLELDWNGVVLADGSGLSRANRISPRFLADLQSRVWRSNLQAQWRELMAVSAASGTLRHRLRDTVAARRVYGKTGSLRDVGALVGTVVGPPGRELHFAITGNGLTSTSAMRTLTDRVVLAMTEELYECRRVRPPREPGRRGRRGPRPAAHLVCAAGSPG